MKNTSSGLSAAVKNNWLQAIQAMSYKNIAGGLADEMMGFIRSSEPRKCRPPFNMVIVDRRGTVVFECQVSKDGKVRPFGLVRRVRRSHFPATALLTDRSLVTRTFLIERATPSITSASRSRHAVPSFLGDSAGVHAPAGVLRSSETR
jgi:hypothetical protein